MTVAEQLKRALILSPAKEAVLRVCREIPEVDFVHHRVGPDSTANAFASAARLLESERCTHVVATSESNMLLAGRLRERYGLPGLNASQTLAVTDKRHMHQTYSRTVRMAPRWDVSPTGPHRDALEGFTDFVIKPAAGSSSRGIERHPVDLLGQVVASGTGPRVLEAALEVDAEFHCDGIFTADGVTDVVVSMYNRPVLEARGKTRASFHLPDDHEMSVNARRLLFDIIASTPATEGVFHIELMLVGRLLYLGEIALRPAGGGVAESIRRHRGLDLWDAFVRLQIGLRPKTPEPFSPDPLLPWAGVVGVVPATVASCVEQRSFLMNQPEVVSLERLSPSEDRVGESCSFSWHAYFRSSSERSAYLLTERILEKL